MTFTDSLTLLGLGVFTLGIIFVFGLGWAAILDGGILFLAGIGAHLNGRKASVATEQAIGDEPA